MESFFFCYVGSSSWNRIDPCISCTLKKKYSEILYCYASHRKSNERITSFYFSCPLLRNVWEKDSFRASIQNRVYRNNVATHDRIFEIRKKAFHFSIISKNDV